MGFSALIVPVPAADWLLAGRRQEEHSRAAGQEVPAHVTLLAPFAPREELSDGVIGELADLFADVVPFSFGLDEVTRFPDGPVYLAPEPAAPFRQLTLELTRLFPEYPPYEGEFEDLTPHVTVPLHDGEELADVARLVAARGPLRAYAQEAVLLWVEDEPEVVARFRFGTTAA